MNDFDRENLQFLMNCSIDEFDAWAEAMDLATVAYMLKLIRQEREALELEELSYLDEMAEQDLTEANAVLSRFTLKG